MCSDILIVSSVKKVWRSTLKISIDDEALSKCVFAPFNEIIES